jgi:hypothetical protein
MDAASVSLAAVVMTLIGVVTTAFLVLAFIVLFIGEFTDFVLRQLRLLGPLQAYLGCRREFHVWLAQAPQDFDWARDMYCHVDVHSPTLLERDQLLAMTRQLDAHPAGYRGLCECRCCQIDSAVAVVAPAEPDDDLYASSCSGVSFMQEGDPR